MVEFAWSLLKHPEWLDAVASASIQPHDVRIADLRRFLGGVVSVVRDAIEKKIDNQNKLGDSLYKFMINDVEFTEKHGVPAGKIRLNVRD